MNKQTVIVGIVGLLVGGLLVDFMATLAVNSNNQGIMHMMGINAKTNDQGIMHSNDMTMHEMSSMLEGRSGDAFDKAFISGMIAHHQGAIDMVKRVQADAKHAELKAMAEDIFSVQSKEIDQMQTWQTEWGYKITPQSHEMGH